MASWKESRQANGQASQLEILPTCRHANSRRVHVRCREKWIVVPSFCHSYAISTKEPRLPWRAGLRLGKGS
jgi:hypothetical protein